MLETSTHRLRSLDGLRGLAALVIAITFHYRHFYNGTTQPPPAWFDNLVFRSLLAQGYMAVDLFFLISGFIFAHVYYGSISTGHITGTRFFVLRFARLYPVHLVTTLAVGVAAWISLICFGETALPYIGASDAYHLLLNLLMLQHIGLQADHSFNFVSWSLTQEAICYCIFFCLARFTKVFELGCGTLVIFGIYLLFNRLHDLFLTPELGRALFGFFAGCLLARAIAAGLARPVGMAAGGLLAMVCLQQALPVMPKGVTSVWGASGDILTTTVVVLPAAMVLSLTLPPLRWALSTWTPRKLGERSYSIYMVHIFVQCVLIMVAKSFDTHIPYDRRWFYVTYVVAVLVTAEAVFRGIERPANRWLRAKYAS